MSSSENAGALPGPFTGLAAIALAALLLAAAAQPIFTDDAWWHLALGRAYAAQGPWLAADPLLYTAVRAPAPAAWLSDLALYGVSRACDFIGLRVAHALLVAAILALAWSLLRRAAGRAAVANLAFGAFVALAAYRLVQLRPELLSVLATLVLVRLLFERAEPPSWRRVALSTGLLGVWANAHGGFLLGPILIAAAVLALFVAQPLRSAAERRADIARARRLAVALCAGVAATLVNPNGLEQYLAYFAAGGETPELTRVADEWLRFDPFRLPVPRLPPSPLAWAIVWGLLIAVPVVAVRAIRSFRTEPAPGAHVDLDPVAIALAAAAIVAMGIAVRFLWLGIFPLLLVAAAHRAGLLRSPAPARVGAWAAAALAWLLVPGFVLFGDWPMISRGVELSSGAYAQPYPAGKYAANAVWMLDDAALEGNLFVDYSLGGFAGYWLAPELRAFVNGTLNVPIPVLDASVAIRARRGLAPDETFLELLDRYEVDLFLGNGLARVGTPSRPASQTTRHLERAPGWTLVYRDLISSVHLRANARNRENLERVRAFYALLGVPFDAERGFDPASVIREAPQWALEHGLVPVHLAGLEAQARGLDPAARERARDRIAAIHAALGLYESAVRIDRSALIARPGAAATRQRLAWSLLQLGLAEEARAAIEPEREPPPVDPHSLALAESVRRYAALEDPEEAASFAARLPLLTRPQARALLDGVVPPRARTSRALSSPR